MEAGFERSVLFDLTVRPLLEPLPRKEPHCHDLSGLLELESCFLVSPQSMKHRHVLAGGEETQEKEAEYASGD